jgi:SAM-dependent methyltransferase
MTRPADEFEHDPEQWWNEHFEDAASIVVEFLSSDDIPLEGKVVADVGSGDGIIDLGVFLKGRPAKLVGYDVRPVDVDGLLRVARAAEVVDELPEELSFAVSKTESIPAPPDTFDVVFTWSAFEHIARPVQVLAEIARILKPGGALFLQLWPFFKSEHGGHLWPHYDDPFPHLRRADEDIVDDVAGRRGTDPSRPADDEYRSLNRMTVEELHRALLRTGFRVRKLHLLTHTVHVPDEVSHLSLADAGIGGIELLATTEPQPDAPAGE